MNSKFQNYEQRNFVDRVQTVTKYPLLFGCIAQIRRKLETFLQICTVFFYQSIFFR